MLELSEFERKLLWETQDGVPLTKKPFEEMAEELNVSTEKVLETFEKLLKENKIRRFGASLAHREVGVSANAMIVWDIPNDVVGELAKEISEFEEVSHCYERPRKKDWNYNLFTMVHGETEEECVEKAYEISEEVGVEEFDVLFSAREFKKTGVKLPKPKK